jgi:hypothetical protein
MGKSQPRRNPGSDGYGPVDPGSDDAVQHLGGGEHPDGGLILRGDDRSPVCELEAQGARIAVDRDDEEAALARSPQQPELGRAGP